MILKVITSRACGHCKKYVALAERYINVETADILTDPSVHAVPYSRLYDENTLIAEWSGANIEPLFDALKEDYMRIRFVTECIDKFTGQLYKKGVVKMFPKERANELIELGVAKEVKSKNDTDNDK